MLLLHPPTREQIDEFLNRVADLPWSYPQIGATRHRPPTGFAHDSASIDLGAGEAVFNAARHAIEQWSMLPKGIYQMFGEGRKIEPGQVVAVAVRTGLVNVLGACRIVYRVDDTENARQRRFPYRARFGFAYGTLTEHVICGEAFVSVTWDRRNRVIYQLECFSRPQHWLARLGYPYFRWQQRRVHRLSLQAMQAAVQEILASDQAPSYPPSDRQQSLSIAG